MALIIGVFAMIGTVKAAEVSDSDYELLRKVFSAPRIALMSNEEAEKYLSYDLENTVTETKYYKVIENENTSTNIEITKEAYDNAIIPYGATVTTNYKSLHISRSLIGGNSYLVNLAVEWKVTPKVKSFDVLGIRTYESTVSDGTQDGTQVFWTAAEDSYDMVSYSPNGTNISKQTKGFGISMNLVDAASYFYNEISATVIATSNSAKVYGSYQHATVSVTLAQSQRYVISPNGLGGVLNFDSSVYSYYDGMDGVSLALPYSG